MSRHVTFCTWDQAPHLTEEVKAELWASIPPYQRDARSKGIPALGSGAIFPIAEENITVKDFELPAHWPKAFAMDHGWNWFGAVWMAYDRDSQTRYLYSCYKRSQAEPPIHAEAIKARGAWVPGVGDCSDINKYDGQQFLKIYRNLGLTLKLANKAVETGLTEMWKELSSGKLKVFGTCGQWFDEYRLYHRNEQGVIVKVNDHLMDPTRYLVRAGWDIFKTEAEATYGNEATKDPFEQFTRGSGGSSDSWMGA